MLRRRMLGLVALLAAAPRRAWAEAPPSKKGSAKVPARKVPPKDGSFRPHFVPKQTVRGELRELPNVRARAERPEGWVEVSEGSDTVVLARDTPGRNAAVFVTEMKIDGLQQKMSVGLLMPELARQVIKRFHKTYKPGARELAWEITAQPQAYRRDGGRAGRMMGRTRDRKGRQLEGYVGVVVHGARAHVLVGSWPASESEAYLPAVDTMLATFEQA